MKRRTRNPDDEDGGDEIYPKVVPLRQSIVIPPEQDSEIKWRAFYHAARLSDMSLSDAVNYVVRASGSSDMAVRGWIQRWRREADMILQAGDVGWMRREMVQIYQSSRSRSSRLNLSENIVDLVEARSEEQWQVKLMEKIVDLKRTAADDEQAAEEEATTPQLLLQVLNTASELKRARQDKSP